VLLLMLLMPDQPRTRRARRIDLRGLRIDLLVPIFLMKRVYSLVFEEDLE
jgi:hypothetical protein